MDPSFEFFIKGRIRYLCIGYVGTHIYIPVDVESYVLHCGKSVFESQFMNYLLEYSVKRVIVK